MHVVPTPFAPRSLARAILGVLAATALVSLDGCQKTKELDSNEHDKTTATTPADAGADSNKPAHRSVDWTFDTEDPARDYVGRYLRATLRYGRDTSCVLLGRLTFRNNDAVVEVRNPADNTCGPPAALRDRFLADVALDRIKLDDPSHQAPLRPWPDGSSPDGPPNEVVDVQNLVSWRSPLREGIKKQKLWPLRIQLYGRGTYPVVSIAGWHDLFDPKRDVTALKDAARSLCEANEQSPLAFIGAQGGTVDLILRIDCPDNPHWEHL